MQNLRVLLLTVPVALLCYGAPSFSQEYQDNLQNNLQDKKLERSQPSRYFLGTEESVLLPVNILGMVQKPGQYMVPYRTDLVSLIAYAGGFSENAKISEIKLIRNVANVNGRNGNNGRRVHTQVFKVDMERYFEKGDQSQIPQLMPDDTIVVGGSTAQTINKFFDFVSKAAMLAQIYFFIKVAND